MSCGHRHHGMTVIELTLGLASVAVLGLAISSLMLAAGNAWDTTDDFVEQTQSIRAVAARVEQWVRQSKRVVSTAADARYADVVLWASDNADAGHVNLGEIKVLTYDQTLGTLTLYQAASSANTALDPAVVGSDNFAPSFRARNDVTAYPFAEQVNGFAAVVTNGMYADTRSYRYLHLALSMRSPDGSNDQTVMIGAAVRAPEMTVDFIGETEVTPPEGGRSVQLGDGVQGLNIPAAVNLSPSSAVASVFVGSSALAVNVGTTDDGLVGASVVSGSTGSSASNNNGNRGSNGNGNGNGGGQGDSPDDHDRGRGNDDRDNGRGRH